MEPRTVLDKVVAAISLLAEPSGASRPAIAKCMTANYGETSAALLKRAIAAGVKCGKLVQTGQRFSLAGVAVPPRLGCTVVKAVLKEGSGAVSQLGDTIDVKYVGSLADGSQFDRAAHFRFTLGAGDVIKGWDAGIPGMRVGERARLEVPPSLGYGKKGSAPEIPPNATLTFDVTLNSIAGPVP
ncbi:hypothetical protein KFE25_005841 [Diacronema lutheri]|uniref:peptidylprolyl isomerase n=2 Tax=Diacronema lutheri TaxID=2081491 RepID=A0A8J6CFR4_DIALT|nr:hypothetical protein KFE25_005841 [Diacronema lutheri]